MDPVRGSRTRRRALALWACAVAALAATTLGGAGSLPGGTSLDVTISAPANGATLPLGPVALNGTTSVGTGAAVAKTALIYVLDLSGSTQQVDPGTTTCGNVNLGYDSVPNTRLDCELAATLALNNLAAARGTVAAVGLIGFAGGLQGLGRPITDNAKAADLSPVAGDQLFTSPADAAFATVVSSAYISGFGFVNDALGNGFDRFTRKQVGNTTNYWAAITELKTLLAEPALSALTKQVVFVSDGESTETGTTSFQALMNTIPANVRIDTFAIGAGRCVTGLASGDLQDISGKAGRTPIRGTCTQVATPSSLPSILPDAVASHLTGISLSGGGTPSAVTTGAPLPLTGPDSTTWSGSVSGLAAGTHHLCVDVAGTDGGGNGTTQACVDVTLKAPPTVDFPGGGGAGSTIGTVAEGSAFALSPSVSDGAVTWSAPPACTFGDEHAASTTVTCYDDGDYALTITVDDGVNAPIERTVTLHVTNVAPTVTLTLSPDPHRLGAGAGAHVAIADPGHDAWTCVIDWGDGTPADLLTASSAGTCDIGRAQTVAGAHTVTVTVTDDDGGVGTASTPIYINSPATVHAFDASGTEGSTIALHGTAADDVAVTAVHWEVGPGEGTCTIAAPDQLDTTITCTDDGPYTLTLSADDGLNDTAFAEATLAVANLSPVVASTSGAAHARIGELQGVVFPFTDAGADDSHECIVAWGDGTTTPGVVTAHTCAAQHAYGSGGAFTATATVTDDDGGAGSASASVVVDSPPVADAGGNLVGLEGQPMTLHGSVSDDFGVAAHWSASEASAVDSSATCVFGDESAPVTTVTCDDDGQWTISMTADDGINAPVIASTSIVVANIAPSVAITSPAAGSSPRNVTMTAQVTDPGANDSHTCTVAWGDGTTSVVAATFARTCTASHAYAITVAAATIVVTATDDDDATSAPRALALSFNRAPSCSAVAPSVSMIWPPNGSMWLIRLSGATDADGDLLTTTIASIRQDEPLGKPKASPDAARAGGGLFLLRADRLGNGDGRVYTIGYTVADGRGGSCSGSVDVSVPHDQTHAAKKTPGVSVDSLG